MIFVPKVNKLNFFKNKPVSACFKTINLGYFNDERIKRAFLEIDDYAFVNEKADIQILLDTSYGKDEYDIKINADCMYVAAGYSEGVFYAVQTFKQILKNDDICELHIHDLPELDVRGIMLDISRSKVPKLSTLKELVDLFSYVKINHLELYVEGFSYDYPSFKKYTNINKNYLPFDDYLELEKYCNDRFIDLVPNQNGFGHMLEWLKLDEFKDLACCPDGYEIWGAAREPATLDPSDKRSYELVCKMYDDMLPYFKSKFFNMNFDEPLELGQGKSKEIVDELGEANVYINFLLPLVEKVRSYNKTPLMWGDVLIKHPESLSKLPKDLIFVDWGYDHKYDFKNHAERLQEASVKFMLAPGTVTWSNILGNKLDMMGSIKNAAEACKEYSMCLGLLTTDWGDMGHLQYLPISYMGFIYGASLSWSNCDDILEATKFVLGNDKLVDILDSLSQFKDLEGSYRGYGCRLFTAIMWAEHASRYDNPVEFFLSRYESNLIDEENVLKLREHFEKNINELNDLEDSLEKEELLNGIFLLKILLDINVKMKLVYDNQDVDFSEELSSLDQYSMKHKELWNARNVEAGYRLSNQRIIWLKEILVRLNRKETK